MELVIASAHASAGTDQDRLGVFDLDDGRLLVVADGSGGIAGGREAADSALDFFKQGIDELAPAQDPATWSIALADLDLALLDDPNAGEAAAVVVYCFHGQVVGASVGDSEAWMIRADRVIDLTQRQKRKPMLGSGASFPVPLGPVLLRGRLLLATDGLFKYAAAETLAEVALTGSVESAAVSLVEAVRMPNGRLQDDVAVILCESRNGEQE